MRFVLFLFLFCLGALDSYAQQPEETSQQTAQRYNDAGILDAEALGKKFSEADKPKYQKAYDDYLKDLEVIRKTGTAPDNEDLYSDLREMNSEERVIYSESKRGLNRFRGRAF